MEIEIQKQRETPLLSRKRVTAMVTFKGATPSRLELRKEIAKKADADEKLTIIKHIYTRYGNTKAKIIAHVYENAKARDTVEDDYLLKKHPGEQPKAKPEAASAADGDAKDAPAEAAAEEKPVAPAKEAAPEEKAEAAEEKSAEAPTGEAPTKETPAPEKSA